MPTLKNTAVLALAARLLDRPPGGRPGCRIARPDGPAGAADNLAPLVDQYLKALEGSSLSGFDATLEDLASRLSAAAKNGG